MTKPRTFKLTSPPMQGDDIAILQKTINTQFKRWGINHTIAIDGTYGTHTRYALSTILFGLGIAGSELHDGATPQLRVKVRHRALNPAERIRYTRRAGWRASLRRRYTGGGQDVALKWAASQIGVKEHPPGSNHGPGIDAWQKLCGISGAPWCGAFVNRALISAGFPTQPWLRYCPSTEAKAKAGEGGWSWHPLTNAHKGDLILYGTREAVHVGLIDDPASRQTIEGNTSSGDSGSQDNGGMVARRHRDWHTPGFPARGIARPPWKTLP